MIGWDLLGADVRPSLSPQVTPAAAAAAAAPAKKLTGPVGDGECFFWRAMECYYGANCKYKHIPANKGIDKKSWKR